MSAAVCGRPAPTRRPAPPRARRGAAGFTLIEVVAVMVIVGILAGALFAAVQYARRAALESRAAAELEEIRAALDDYFVEEGGFPAVLDTNSLALPVGRLRFSAQGVPMDPWGTEYQFANMGLAYLVFSCGADRIPGTNEAAGQDDIH